VFFLWLRNEPITEEFPFTKDHHVNTGKPVLVHGHLCRYDIHGRQGGIACRMGMNIPTETYSRFLQPVIDLGSDLGGAGAVKLFSSTGVDIKIVFYNRAITTKCKDSNR